MLSPAKTFSGSVPANYDQYMGPLFFEQYAQDLAARIDKGKVQQALEIACGTGRVTTHLRNALPAAATLIATDLNPGMLEVAKQKTAIENIQYQVADAQELSFADDSFDVVVCQFGFMFVPDKPKAFSEAYRVLRPGGMLLFNTWDAIEHNPLSKTVTDVVSAFFPGTGAANFYTIPFSMHDREAIMQWLQEAGFSTIHIEQVTKQPTSAHASDGARGLILGTPVFHAINEIDTTAPEKVIALATEKIAALYGDNPSTSEMNAWVAEAWK
ncbi:MAG: methyltransferase domain-containing protein [Ginsengibacter sp.]